MRQFAGEEYDHFMKNLIQILIFIKNVHIYGYMLKAFRYRLYPTPSQEELIAKHIGSVRFLYNLALETKQTAYAGSKVNLSRYDLSAQIPELKKECPWLKEINSQSL